jgi:hypothetical protein
MSVGSRIKRIEQKLGVGCNIYCTFLILGPPDEEYELMTKAEVDARIERQKQDLIQQKPKCSFFFIC